MRLVVDSNMLRSEMLVDFLKVSRDNKVVLTDYVMMEAYKSRPEITVPQSMRVVCAYKAQVLILKGTAAIGALSGRPSGLTRRMISEGFMRDFSPFCKEIARSDIAERAIRNGMQGHARVAADHMDRVLIDASTILENFAEVAEIFTSEDKRALRKTEPYSKDLCYKIISTTEHLAVSLARGHPHRTLDILNDGVLNKYIFRYALGAILLMIGWVRNGENPTGKAEKMRNDMVDASLATYGTFFDGVLTNDRKLQMLHEEMRAVLRPLGAKIGGR